VTAESSGSGLVSTRSCALITSHGRVLLAVARDPDARVAGLAGATQLSERVVYRVLADLERSGYVMREKRGRCNRYRVSPGLRLTATAAGVDIASDLLALVSLGRREEAHGRRCGSDRAPVWY
jgi:DNA-binding IclR family transcriptional regulator